MMVMLRISGVVGMVLLTLIALFVGEVSRQLRPKPFAKTALAAQSQQNCAVCHYGHRAASRATRQFYSPATSVRQKTCSWADRFAS